MIDQLLAAEIALVRLDLVRRHLLDGGGRLRLVVEAAAGCQGETVDHRGNARLAGPLFLEGSHVLIRARVEHLQIDDVKAVELADGREQEGLGLRPLRHFAAERLVDPRRGAAPRLAEQVEHARARQDRELSRLLQRSDQHPRQPVEALVAGLVGEVGHHHRHGRAAAEELPEQRSYPSGRDYYRAQPDR